jgi:hypothetical protein
MEGTRRLKEALFGRADGSPTSLTKGGRQGARVRYRCAGCGGWSALAGASGCGSEEGVAYWCGDCGAVRCGARCVGAEVEAQYCGQCLDNVTSYDASLFRHRCKKCFRCPACLAPLSFAQQLARASPSTTATAATGSAEQQRVVYLHCSFCRWNSLSLPSPLHADSPTALVSTASLYYYYNLNTSFVLALCPPPCD